MASSRKILRNSYKSPHMANFDHCFNEPAAVSGEGIGLFPRFAETLGLVKRRGGSRLP